MGVDHLWYDSTRMEHRQRLTVEPLPLLNSRNDTLVRERHKGAEHNIALGDEVVGSELLHLSDVCYSWTATESAATESATISHSSSMEWMNSSENILLSNCSSKSCSMLSSSEGVKRTEAECTVIVLD